MFQDQTQNSQFELRKLARFMPGGEKRHQNRDSIKCGKRKAGKIDSAIQCYIEFPDPCSSLSSFKLRNLYNLRFIESEICLPLFEYETQPEHIKPTPFYNHHF